MFTQASQYFRTAVGLYRDGGLRHLYYKTEGYILTNLKYNIHRYNWRIKFQGSLAEEYKILWVDPKVINHFVHPGFYTKSRTGSWIVGGEWDRRSTKESEYNNFRYVNQRKIFNLDNNYDFYRAMREHFEYNVPWEETEFYERALQRVSEGEFWHGCSTSDDLLERFREVEDLYKSIKKHGYKTQRELGNPENYKPPEANEIAVDISRDGRLIMDDGRHRLIISQILGVDQVPVRVLVRHRKWQQTRHNIFQSRKVDANHPDLSDIVDE